MNMTDDQLLAYATEFTFDNGVRAFWNTDTGGWMVSRERDGESLHFLGCDGAWTPWAAVNLTKEDHRARLIYITQREAVTAALTYKDTP